MADAMRCPACGEDHPCNIPLGAIAARSACFCALPPGHDGPCKCDHTLSKAIKAAADFEAARQACEDTFRRHAQDPRGQFGRTVTGDSQ